MEADCPELARAGQGAGVWALRRLVVGREGRRLVLGLLGLAGHGIGAGEPAVEVHVGAAAAAERAERLLLGLAADWAARGAGGGGVLGHRVQYRCAGGLPVACPKRVYARL